ncbi:MAG: inverse autotransporter beta domain-containing protein [Candidatus Omnitrophica bacterium]|nr:inverse autotransporter beta domain-containing protein [Candidatus Omnitrophota bacterium]
MTALRAGLLLGVFAGLISSPCAGAEPAKNFQLARGGIEQPAKESQVSEPYPEMAEYVKSWEFGISIDEEESPRYFADLLFPVYRPDAEDRTVFLEPRVTHLNSETLLNFGLGYRQFVWDRTWMLGGNTFYDWETTHSHHRIGFGAEAINAHAELRANTYWGISLNKTAEPGISSQIVEKPADGFDLEMGFPIPYYSRLKLFGGYERYNFEKFEDRTGWTVRGEYKPWPFLVLDTTFSDNTKRSPNWGVKIALRPPFWENAPERAASPLKLDKVIFPDADVSDRLYDLVERHHEIVVESYRENLGSVTVEIARGT